jgi:CheY-like chemotaxis protein
MRVVDDEALIVMLTASWLEDHGCEVETALNGTEALTKFGNDPYIEVLITDVNMPRVSGYQLADWVKQMRPGLRVIMLSGAETGPARVAACAQAVFTIRPHAGDVRRG